MVKLKGPAMSVKATGSIGDVLTFSRTKKVQYIKHKPTPAQPQTGNQVSMRMMMKFLSQQWASLTDAYKASWEDAYDDAQITRYYAYIKHNLTRWRSRKAPSKQYPALEAGQAGTGIALYATGKVRHIKIKTAITTSLNEVWGLLLFHSTAGAPDPDFNKLIHVIHITDTQWHYWLNTPLPAGTHYYRVTGFTTTGRLQLGQTATDSGVVT